jgi:hypothetical protein
MLCIAWKPSWAARFALWAPYPFYPVNGYFYGVVRGRKIPACVPDDEPAQPTTVVSTGPVESAYIREKLAEGPLAA